uniref:Uncharacterized protein n=1 Tax=Octopus bimaculoides TaxID=37653 RepID=A0A0L8HSP4_OCTBM
MIRKLMLTYYKDLKETDIWHDFLKENTFLKTGGTFPNLEETKYLPNFLQTYFRQKLKTIVNPSITKCNQSTHLSAMISFRVISRNNMTK